MKHFKMESKQARVGEESGWKGLGNGKEADGM